MTTIWEIPSDSFPQETKQTRYDEETAILHLDEGKTIAFPCKWEHTARPTYRRRKDGSMPTTTICNGTQYAYAVATKQGKFKIRATCRDKVIYVQRAKGMDDVRI